MMRVGPSDSAESISVNPRAKALFTKSGTGTTKALVGNTSVHRATTLELENDASSRRNSDDSISDCGAKEGNESDTT